MNKATGVRFRARLRGQGSDPSSGCRRLVGGEERVRGLEPQTSALLHPAALGTPRGAGRVLGCHAKGSPQEEVGVPGPQHLRRPRPLPWLLSSAQISQDLEGGGSEKGRVSAPSTTFLSRPHLPPDVLLPVPPLETHRTVCCPRRQVLSAPWRFLISSQSPSPGWAPAAPFYRRGNRGPRR